MAYNETPIKETIMKFVVNHDVFNTVEVKLHWETKDKIKKVVAGLSAAVIVGVVCYKVYNKEN